VLRSLITGVTGQDGWYLSEILQANGHQVFGLVSSGDAQELPPGVQAVPGDLRDTASIRAAVDLSRPDHVYNLAALSSVAESWADPVLVADVNGTGVLRLLQALRDRTNAEGGPVAFVQAGSAEIFGDAPAPQDESTPVAPASPYGAAKAFAHQSVRIFRGAGVAASNAVLFNHESPRRPEHFVTRKITATVARIAHGSPDKLVLGDLGARRDWGHARDYMDALTLIAQRPVADDYVLATGESHSVAEFVALAFAHAGIEDWAAHVISDAEFTRAPEQHERRGDAARARDLLGWRPATTFADLVAEMVDADLALHRA
jgi:GDPmannose 4,6-dehydratase